MAGGKTKTKRMGAFKPAGSAWQHQQEQAALLAALMEMPDADILPMLLLHRLGQVYQLISALQLQGEGGPPVNDGDTLTVPLEAGGPAPLPSQSSGVAAPPPPPPPPPPPTPSSALEDLTGGQAAAPQHTHDEAVALVAWHVMDALAGVGGGEFASTLLHSYLMLTLDHVRLAPCATCDTLAAPTGWHMPLGLYADLVLATHMERHMMELLSWLPEAADPSGLLACILDACPALAVGCLNAGSSTLSASSSSSSCSSSSSWPLRPFNDSHVTSSIVAVAAVGAQPAQQEAKEEAVEAGAREGEGLRPARPQHWAPVLYLLLRSMLLASGSGSYSSIGGGAVEEAGAPGSDVLPELLHTLSIVGSLARWGVLHTEEWSNSFKVPHGVTAHEGAGGPAPAPTPTPGESSDGKPGSGSSAPAGSATGDTVSASSGCSHARVGDLVVLAWLVLEDRLCQWQQHLVDVTTAGGGVTVACIASACSAVDDDGACLSATAEKLGQLHLQLQLLSSDIARMEQQQRGLPPHAGVQGGRALLHLKLRLQLVQVAWRQGAGRYSQLPTHAHHDAAQAQLAAGPVDSLGQEWTSGRAAATDTDSSTGPTVASVSPSLAYVAYSCWPGLGLGYMPDMMAQRHVGLEVGGGEGIPFGDFNLTAEAHDTPSPGPSPRPSSEALLAQVMDNPFHDPYPASPSSSTPAGQGWRQGQGHAGPTWLSPLARHLPPPTYTEALTSWAAHHRLRSQTLSETWAQMTAKRAALSPAGRTHVPQDTGAAWALRLAAVAVGFLTPGMPCFWPSLADRPVVQHCGTNPWAHLRLALAWMEMAQHCCGDVGTAATVAEAAAAAPCDARGLVGAAAGRRACQGGLLHDLALPSLLLHMAVCSMGRVDAAPQQQALQQTLMRGSSCQR